MISMATALGEPTAFPMNRMRIVESHDAQPGRFVQYQFVAIGVYRRRGGWGGLPESEGGVVAVFKPKGVAVVALDQCINLTEVFIIN